jgi:hypothetical protein
MAVCWQCAFPGYPQYWDKMIQNHVQKDNNCTKKKTAQKIPERLLQQWCITSAGKLSFWGLFLFPLGGIIVLQLY